MKRAKVKRLRLDYKTYIEHTVVIAFYKIVDIYFEF